jgi:NAD(P)-dependent dehydrogenase (short-subunit alcohol dehydrogenase family)
VDLELKGRRALVSGSSSGIGEAIAHMLAEEGARVVVHGRNRERAEKVASEMGAVGVASASFRPTNWRKAFTPKPARRWAETSRS